MIDCSVQEKRCRYEKAVRSLCPSISEKLDDRKSIRWCEYELRKELVGCVIGSQIRNETAVNITENLEQAGLLDDKQWHCKNNGKFESRIYEVLIGEKSGVAHRSRHRFPKARAKQLAQARDELSKASITERLSINNTPKLMRKVFADHIPGLGPKQASMFLRNVGISYDLAILDTHVLRFMDMQGILPLNKVRIGTIAGYERAEQHIVDYADNLGYPAGYLDWAIWATMKAARELGL